MKHKKRVKHIIKEGARFHVVSYYGYVGPVCSEPDCEINRDLEKRKKEARKHWLERGFAA